MVLATRHISRRLACSHGASLAAIASLLGRRPPLTARESGDTSATSSQTVGFTITRPPGIKIRRCPHHWRQLAVRHSSGLNVTLNPKAVRRYPRQPAKPMGIAAIARRGHNKSRQTGSANGSKRAAQGQLQGQL